MQESDTSQSIEERINDVLEEVMEYFKLEYISDIHIKYYRNKIITYINDKMLETTDYEVYKRIIEYVDSKKCEKFDVELE